MYTYEAPLLLRQNGYFKYMYISVKTLNIKVVIQNFRVIIITQMNNKKNKVFIYELRGKLLFFFFFFFFQQKNKN